MNAEDFYPDENSPLVKTFLKKFGGYFNASIFGAVEYIDKEENTWEVPETETAFYDLLSKSIKAGKNGFLDMPSRNLPKGAII